MICSDAYYSSPSIIVRITIVNMHGVVIITDNLAFVVTGLKYES